MLIFKELKATSLLKIDIEKLDEHSAPSTPSKHEMMSNATFDELNGHGPAWSPLYYQLASLFVENVLSFAL